MFLYYKIPYKQKETTVIKKIFFKNLLDREQWITPSEAKEHIAFSESIIREKAAELIKSGRGKGVVCTKKAHSGLDICFINKDKIKEFAKLTHLTLRQDAEKTDDWLDTNDIFKLVYGPKRIIKASIYKYKQEHPDAIQRKIKDGKKEYCLSVANKDDFIQTYNLQPRTENEWLSMYDLNAHFVEQYKYIAKTTRDLAPLYPQDIQRQKRGSNTVLCVKSTFVDTFAKIAKLTTHQATITEIKTDNWLNADEIAALIHRNHSKILFKMRELKGQNDPIVSVRFNKKRWPLCVHKKDLKEFLVQTGILTSDQIKTNKNLISFYQRQR